MLKTISADPSAQTTDHTPFFLMVVSIWTNLEGHSAAFVLAFSILTLDYPIE
jgi:hypothetical protein